MSCLCCLKKRDEVYILRNIRGIDNNMRNSDTSISSAERGQYYTEEISEEQRQVFEGLRAWTAEQMANHQRATQEQRLSEQIEIQNRTNSGVNLPPTHPQVHAQNLDDTQVENEML